MLVLAGSGVVVAWLIVNVPLPDVKACPVDAETETELIRPDVPLNPKLVDVTWGPETRVGFEDSFHLGARRFSNRKLPPVMRIIASTDSWSAFGVDRNLGLHYK